MSVHVGERRMDSGEVIPCYLLDRELSFLSEGFCPFSYVHDPRFPDDPDCDAPGIPLAVTPDGWARCPWGDEYRFPAQVWPTDWTHPRHVEFRVGDPHGTGPCSWPVHKGRRRRVDLVPDAAATKFGIRPK